MKQIERSKQIEAVRRFCKALPDGQEFTVCVLLMNGMPENKIRRRLRLNNGAWEQLKTQIADGLIKAGVQLRS